MATDPTTDHPDQADGSLGPPPLHEAGGRADRADTACGRRRGPHALRPEALREVYHAGLAAVGAIVVTTTDLEELHPGGCPGCVICGRLLPILQAGRAAVLEAARAARR